ncbi:50S ribosomal protein L30 [Candidatus Woesearchaeota archaeon]|jgi:large subunit ribosomal protein L30|nr:50S ribosomal protein L30 [Candidatus Woesearchaeota archaeon]MBT4835219.1 50S ribosomal protein L30 [Candidatus Woesearchaeota archaeon]MBT6734906.1 50S ribosomal protein L30 [Candidatus Woesearchaeota archaeon]MBT7169579.1 50S ribosomal protein L30 [Candidatus Woesearchaeota archaeon]MBT7474537.1 50S ribosomal protein L30 [Candidatus Woesearchaeota archaeon]
MTRIAIIRISGEQGLNEKVKTTFKLLNLHKKYNCVIVSNTAQLEGMLKVIKDNVTWGEIDKETISTLLEKRGRLPGNKPITSEYIKEKIKLDLGEFAEGIFAEKNKIKDVEGLKPFFRLMPPRKGFERKGTKRHFSIGGALGYRKYKINDLIQRMI